MKYRYLAIKSSSGAFANALPVSFNFAFGFHGARAIVIVAATRHFAASAFDSH
jgi:hypothetical protein